MNMPNWSGYQAYQKHKYETASPHKLISLLYEALIKNLHRSVHALEQNNTGHATQYMIKSQEILAELMSSLNEKQGGDIAKNLKSLYLYAYNQIVQANIHKDAKILQEVSGYITDLSDAWNEIGKEVGLGSR